MYLYTQSRAGIFTSIQFLDKMIIKTCLPTCVKICLNYEISTNTKTKTTKVCKIIDIPSCWQIIKNTGQRYCYHHWPT